MGVPTMYSYLLGAYDKMGPEEQAAARRAAARLRLTVSGSAACPLPVMQRWEELSGARPVDCGRTRAPPPPMRAARPACAYRLQMQGGAGEAAACSGRMRQAPGGVKDPGMVRRFVV